jgi:hypothetical protein
VSGEPAAGDQQPAAARAARRRPVLVEIAAALLIVGGAINLLISVDVLIRLAQQGSEIGLLTAITIALGISTFGLGLAVRYGRAWLIAVNVAAVLGFLELLSGTTIGLLFGSLDVLVVLALARERPWFEWEALRRAELARAQPRRAGSR